MTLPQAITALAIALCGCTWLLGIGALLVIAWHVRKMGQGMARWVEERGETTP